MDQTICSEDIDVLSIEKVFINDFYNDLGFVEGKAEGLKEGRVLTYLELGFSYKEISEKLGISEEEIKKIEEKIL